MADPQSRSRPDEPAERRPWRVEGQRDEPEAPPPPQRRMPRMPGGRRFWWFLLGLLALNIVLGQLIPSSADRRINVPYTFFRDQVTAGNVTEVNARADVIQGKFRKATKFEDK